MEKQKRYNPSADELMKKIRKVFIRGRIIKTGDLEFDCGMLDFDKVRQFFSVETNDRMSLYEHVLEFPVDFLKNGYKEKIESMRKLKDTVITKEDIESSRKELLGFIDAKFSEELSGIRKGNIFYDYVRECIKGKSARRISLKLSSSELEPFYAAILARLLADSMPFVDLEEE